MPEEASKLETQKEIESTKNSEVYIRVKKTHFYTAILMIFSFIFGYAFNGINSGSNAPTGGTGNIVAPTGGGELNLKIDVSQVEEEHVLGDANAKVTIIEFSDFECPFCGKFFTDTLGSIKSEYIDTGKAKLIYKDFPLSFHQNAQSSAEAAECASEQGKFYEMHDKIFQNQQALAVADLKQYAVELGLDSAEFNDCLDTEKYKTEVLGDQNEGAKLGVSGTPSFYINGKEVVGAQPYSVFKAEIDAALAG